MLDGAMVNSEATFLSPLFYIPVAEAVAAVPPHTAQDDCREVMTLMEQRRASQWETSIRSKNLLPYHETSFLQQKLNSSNPALRLVLGADALDAIHAKLTTVVAELADWKDVSINTAFDGGTVSPIGG